MTYQEQRDWLLKNGFEEPWSADINFACFSKQLDEERRICVTRYSSPFNAPEWCWDLIQTSLIHQEEIALFPNVPDDEDFEKYQPLIDLLK